MKVIKAPHHIPVRTNKYQIFLAGSIEMGTAVDWQNKLIDAISNPNVQFLNPRRDDWDSSWEQKIDNEQFYSQVNWELDGIDSANRVIFYFDPATKSPISLLELGLVAGTKLGRVTVCCPEGFWRKGNVDIICERYNLKLVTTLDELIEDTKMRI